MLAGHNLHASLTDAVRRYWNEHIHDLAITTHPAGSAGFFLELEEYRFDKLRYLSRVVDSPSYQGKKVLEIGCGVGTDLVRFARAGALVTGVDLAETSISLAQSNFQHNQLAADLRVMDGEDLKFEDHTFDVVYAHGVLQYTANPHQMVRELHRVLRTGGEAILMMYNKYSWLYTVSSLTRERLEHQDAPVYRLCSIRQFRRMLGGFQSTRIMMERFPVRTRIHAGLKGRLFNDIFLPMFHLVPKPLVRPIGWHMLAFARKGVDAPR